MWKPLLLVGFWCNAIFSDKNDQQSLPLDLSVNVKIVESRTMDGETAEVLVNRTAKLGSKFNLIQLSHPILIRPYCYYTICINGFPKGHYFQSHVRRSYMSLAPGIGIEFFNDKVIDGKAVSLILALAFNKL